MPPISVNQFQQLAQNQSAATRIRLDRNHADQILGQATSVRSRIGHWLGELMGGGKARNREAIDAFVQSLRTERGDAAGDLAAAYLSRRRAQGRPLAPRHIETGLRLTGVAVDSARTFAQALERLGIGDDFKRIGRGGEGKAYAVRVRIGNESMDRVLKTRDPEHVEPMQIDPGLGVQGKAARLGETAAAYIGADIPGLIRPDFYIVGHAAAATNAGQIDAPDSYEAMARTVEAHTGGSKRNTTFSVVAGGKQFRKWATERLIEGNPPTLMGVVMPRAKGAPVTDLSRITETLRDESASQLEPAHLLTATRALIRTHAGMAQHGLCHRDLKPENVYFDPHSGSVEVFDQGSMAKISKSSGEAPPITGAITRPYSAPGFPDTDGAGLEYDLFSAGVMMLEASLRARGLHDIAHAVLSDVQKSAGASNVIPDLAHLADQLIQGDDTVRAASTLSPRAQLKSRIHEQVADALDEQTPAGRLALRMIDIALDLTQPVITRYDPANPQAHPFGVIYGQSVGPDASDRAAPQAAS